MTSSMERCAGGEQAEATAKQGMAQVDDLNLRAFFFIWVIEWGIQVGDRSTN